MIWRFHPEAAEEFFEACTYYSEISLELVRAFHASIEDGIEKILAGPRVWPVVEDDVRRFLVRRFPYGIYYTLVDDENVVLIVAVMHMRRQSGYWRDRLDSQRLDLVEHDDETYRVALRQLVGGLLGRGPRDLPEVPDGLDVPPPPADVLPGTLRRRLVEWLSPYMERKVFRSAVATALGVPRATLEGHATPQGAASAAIVAATGDDDRVEAARRIVRALRDAFDEEDDAGQAVMPSSA